VCAVRAVLAVATTLVLVGSGSASAAPPRNDFTLSATPRTVTVHAGKSAHFTIAVPRGTGFHAAIGLQVRGLPRHTSGGFTPFGAGYDLHRTLIIATTRAAKAGIYDLRVVASGGNRVHRRHVTLKIVQ
jgi:hypothetical protein